MEKDITDVKFKDVSAQIQATLAINIKPTESHIKYLAKEHPDYSSHGEQRRNKLSKFWL